MLNVVFSPEETALISSTFLHIARHVPELAFIRADAAANEPGLRIAAVRVAILETASGYQVRDSDLLGEILCKLIYQNPKLENEFIVLDRLPRTLPRSLADITYRWSEQNTGYYDTWPHRKNELTVSLLRRVSSGRAVPIPAAYLFDFAAALFQQAKFAKQLVRCPICYAFRDADSHSCAVCGTAGSKQAAEILTNITNSTRRRQ